MSQDQPNTDLIQGSLDMLILKALSLAHASSASRVESSRLRGVSRHPLPSDCLQRWSGGLSTRSGARRTSRPRQFYALTRRPDGSRGGTSSLCRRASASLRLLRQRLMSLWRQLRTACVW